MIIETEREKKYQHYIEEFYHIAQKILNNFPEDLDNFEKLWQKKDFRGAYSLFMMKRDKSKLLEKELKIDEEFFWLFVN